MSPRSRLAAPLSILLSLALPGAAPCAPVPSPPPTKGQGQLAGGNCRFGEIYTLKNSYNFVIYSAHYTMEPLSCYMDGIAPNSEEKLLTVDIAFKNVAPVDNAINTEHMFAAVDSVGQLYTYFSIAQDSMGKKGFNGMRRPGQGFGQPELKDGLHVAFRVPAKVRIVKIMINAGRKLVKPDEQVMRYYIAGATKAEAGADGDPKNIIAPLPANVVDTSDKSGAVALEEGKGVVGQDLPCERFHVKLNSVGSTTDPVTGDALRADKKYVVLNITAKLVVETEVDLGYVQSQEWQLTDSDGESYKPVNLLKASSKENAGHKFQKGDEYTFRAVYLVPKSAMFKKLVIGGDHGRKWAFDGSIIQ